MITDTDGLIAHLVNWLRSQAAASNTKNGCVGLSGGIDSAVVFALCCRAFPETVGVLMPCHSSPESVDRAKEVLRSQANLGFACRGLTVPLETAFQFIVDSVEKASMESHMERAIPDEKACTGALRSCLRAPVLDYVSKCYNSLVYGTGNRDEDEVFRYYQKRGDGAVDNNVLVGLHKSEVRQLATALRLPQSILDAVPSADLWGGEAQTDEGELGLTYDEIEWITRRKWLLQERAKYIDLSLFAKYIELSLHHVVPKLTARQLEIVEKAYNMERISRHKASPPPGPRREEISFYVI